MSRRHVVTTGCVIAITALALTPVQVAARSRTADTSVAPSAWKPPPGMLEALQRDLSLTKEQAQARLVNEARLAPVEAELRRKLGARFAGSWFAGTIAQNLVVATTASSDIPQITAAGARAEVVTRSLADLVGIKEHIDGTVPPRRQAGTVRYVDVRTNKVVVLSKEVAQATNVLESSGVDPVAVRVEASEETPQLLDDIIGGIPYYIGTSERCSIGFSVTHGSQNGFVSAGHCGKKGETTSSTNWSPQGVFEGSTFPGSDYSWVAVNANWTPKPEVSNGSGGTVSVVGSRAAIEGASVCRSGSTTGWHCGTIQQRDTSIAYPQGTVYELVRTNVCAEPGDSGGSFISVDQAQGVTSGGSGNCREGGVTYFQPVGEILTVYGLSLLTTPPAPPRRAPPRRAPPRRARPPRVRAPAPACRRTSPAP